MAVDDVDALDLQQSGTVGRVDVGSLKSGKERSKDKYFERGFRAGGRSRESVRA